jgi:hypothetical protein
MPGRASTAPLTRSQTVPDTLVQVQAWQMPHAAAAGRPQTGRFGDSKQPRLRPRDRARTATEVDRHAGAIRRRLLGVGGRWREGLAARPVGEAGSGPVLEDEIHPVSVGQDGIAQAEQETSFR